MINKVAKKFYVLCAVVFVAILVLCCCCKYNGYSSEYSDLYTVAVNSLLWNTGNSYDAEREIDPQIEIIEKDTFGRVLFSYRERYYSGAKLSFSALLISQKSSEGYVYYYEDYNFVIMEQEVFSVEIRSFANDIIQNLKTANDWNKEIVTGKCVKKEIENIKKEIPGESKYIEEKVVEKFDLANRQKNIFTHFLTYDNNCNYIIYGNVINNENNEDIYFAILIKQDNNVQDLIFFVPEDVYKYHDEFAKFKQDNGWRTD